jgi:hypothetical protein
MTDESLTYQLYTKTGKYSPSQYAGTFDKTEANARADALERKGWLIRISERSGTKILGNIRISEGW